MKIFCHNGILPNVDILDQYGVKVQEVYKRNNERDACIIELPNNLKLIRLKDLPKPIAAALHDVIVDENESIIGNLSVSDVVARFDGEIEPYDYHAGVVKFFRKRYPTPIELDEMSRTDIDSLYDIIEEMRSSQEEQKSR